MFRFIILAVALVAGGGAAWMAFAMRGGEPVVATVVHDTAPAPTREVLVASIDLAAGQTLTGESLRWQAWPESAVQASYINRSSRPDAQQRLVGAIIRGSVMAGEPIREERLAPLNSGLLSSMLRPGKRAVAVRITAENTAGGFILPNDRVDVLHTVGSREKAEGQKDYTTRTILTNVSVLAIDQTLDEKNKDKDEKAKAKPATVGKTATLELDPRQVELLAAAEAAGTISLALRSSADNAEIATVPPPAATPQVNQAVFIVRGGNTATSVPVAPKAP